MLCSWTIQECPNTFNPFNIASISLVSVNISRGSVYKASEQIVTLMWLQVLTAVQRVLGAVRMQQQRDQVVPELTQVSSQDPAKLSECLRLSVARELLSRLSRHCRRRKLGGKLSWVQPR